MGDDPFIPAPLISNEATGAPAGSAATGGNNIFINNLGKTGFTIIVVFVGLAVGLSIGAVVMVAWGSSVNQEHTRYMIEAAEKRAMDRAMIAEREARVAVDQFQTARIELAKRGIVIQVDDHQ